VDLQVSTRDGRGCTVVRVAGELDMDTRPQLRNVLDELADEGVRQLVLDMTDLTFMDSSGLGLLVEVLKRLRDVGGRLSLASVQPSVRNVLTLSALDQAMAIHDTVAAAEEDMPQST
jgi:anti-sigma B factor antagonist